MTQPDPVSKAAPKRGKGRPVPGKNDVGREGLLAATEKLLRTIPPARVTIPRVAREANVTPSLVYYHFGSRDALLLAVVDRVTVHDHREPPKGDPATALAAHIAQTVKLVRRAPYMNRLMIDELAQAEPDETRDRVRHMNLELIDFYRTLLKADGGKQLVEADPFYLFVAVLGASDFLSSAGPLIQGLLPKNTDMDKLADGYQAFLVKLLMHGMMKSAAD